MPLPDPPHIRYPRSRLQALILDESAREALDEAYRQGLSGEPLSGKPARYRDVADEQTARWRMPGANPYLEAHAMGVKRYVRARALKYNDAPPPQGAGHGNESSARRLQHPGRLDADGAGDGAPDRASD